MFVYIARVLLLLWFAITRRNDQGYPIGFPTGQCFVLGVHVDDFVSAAALEDDTLHHVVVAETVVPATLRIVQVSLASDFTELVSHRRTRHLDHVRELAVAVLEQRVRLIKFDYLSRVENLQNIAPCIKLMYNFTKNGFVTTEPKLEHERYVPELYLNP